MLSAGWVKIVSKAYLSYPNGLFPVHVYCKPLYGILYPFKPHTAYSFYPTTGKDDLRLVVTHYQPSNDKPTPNY